MNREVWKNVHLRKTNSILKFIHEHAFKLRIDFDMIATNMTSKKISKLFMNVFKHFREFYNELTTRLLTQFHLEQILADMQFNFDRIIHEIKYQIYE